MSARLAIEYVTDISFETFEADVQTQDSVVHRLEIIGEAAGRLPESITVAMPDVPWVRIRGMRHLLVHQYWETDIRRVWSVVHDDLPPLIAAIEAYLA